MEEDKLTIEMIKKEIDNIKGDEEMNESITKIKSILYKLLHYIEQNDNKQNECVEAINDLVTITSNIDASNNYIFNIITNKR